MPAAWCNNATSLWQRQWRQAGCGCSGLRPVPPGPRPILLIGYMVHSLTRSGGAGRGEAWLQEGHSQPEHTRGASGDACAARRLRASVPLPLAPRPMPPAAPKLPRLLACVDNDAFAIRSLELLEACRTANISCARSVMQIRHESRPGSDTSGVNWPAILRRSLCATTIWSTRRRLVPAISSGEPHAMPHPPR